LDTARTLKLLTPVQNAEMFLSGIARTSLGTINTRTGFSRHALANIAALRFCTNWSLQIFLVLREHLGDENLDLAGGVLYELIEIDCEHTDDPGAAFQRWRHDHMSRHVNPTLFLRVGAYFGPDILY
jgi:hypothetical protein